MDPLHSQGSLTLSADHHLPFALNAGSGTVSSFAVHGANLSLLDTATTGGNTISSYQLQWNRSLETITSALPTQGQATCWDVLAGDGRFVYTSNAATSTVSGFSIGRRGQLTPIGATVLAENPEGSTNIDIAASADGHYLYTLNAAAGAIGIFSVQQDGGLANLGQFKGLPASAGLNGIAAY